MTITDAASGITSDELEDMGFEQVDTMIMPDPPEGSYRPRLFVTKAKRAEMLEQARQYLGPDAHWHYDPVAQARFFRESDDGGYRPEWATFIHVNRERCPP